MKKTIMLVLMSFISIGIISCGVNSLDPEKLSPQKLPEITATWNGTSFDYKINGNSNIDTPTISISKPTTTGKAIGAITDPVTAAKPYEYTVSDYKPQDILDPDNPIPYSHYVYRSTANEGSSSFTTPTRIHPTQATTDDPWKVTVAAATDKVFQVRVWVLKVVEK